jgi:hypothetical protein
MVMKPHFTATDNNGATAVASATYYSVGIHPFNSVTNALSLHSGFTTMHYLASIRTELI